MSVPYVPLLMAPSDSGDPFGRAIMSADLIAGLKKINPRIWVDEGAGNGLWWPGKASGTLTIWLGNPQLSRHAKKISGFTHGPIPEFTQTGPNGEVLMKGWRAIFKKVVEQKAATTRAIENRFKVSLEVSGLDGSCPSCRREGKVVKVSAGGLCEIHASVKRTSNQAKDLKSEIKYLRRIDKCLPSQSALRNSPMVFLRAPASVSNGFPAK